MLTCLSHTFFFIQLPVCASLLFKVDGVCMYVCMYDSKVSGFTTIKVCCKKNTVKNYSQSTVYTKYTV